MSHPDAKLIKYNIAPGFHRESTQYAEEGKWYDGDKVRFREGRPENLRGWAKRVNTPFDGTARDLRIWSDNNTRRLAAFGTEKKLYVYDGNDVEGISAISNNKVLLVEERTKEVVEYDLSSKISKKHKIIYSNNESNSGLEGVAINSIDNTIFIINEKNPGVLMRLRSDFSIIESYELDFASDYSGIFHDRELNILWILSDESKTINKCSLQGILIKSYAIDVIKAEGIAVTTNTIYIVSDSNSTLYEFKKPIE